MLETLTSLETMTPHPYRSGCGTHIPTWGMAPMYTVQGLRVVDVLLDINVNACLSHRI